MSAAANERLDTPPGTPNDRSNTPPTTPNDTLLTDTSLAAFQLDLPMGNKSSKVKEMDMMSAVLGVMDDVNAEEKRRLEQEMQEKQFVEEHMKRQKYLNRHSWKRSIFGGGVASWG